MKISFTHTNPEGSHDSTLLTIEADDSTSQYLIDAGENATPGAFTGADEGFDGVFLTHAHRDHYASLSQALDTGDPTLYTSPDTGVIIEQVYGEANRYQDLGDIGTITDALTPIDTWTSLNDDIDVLPVPAGHTPGAAGFLFRVDDFDANDETVTILATGDFTTHPVAGYPGLAVPKSVDIDILIANGAISPDFKHTLSTATETILERALSGATTLVPASALMSIHAAYLFGHLCADLDRDLPIHLVGQAAKLYTALDYEVPAVTPHATFDDPDAVMAPGAVTIGGPQDADSGSTGRLLDRVEGDADSVVVQLATSDATPVEATQAATHYFELSPHPTEAEFKTFVEDHLPRHLVIKHANTSNARRLGEDFPELFHWTNDDTQQNTLYDDGSWPAPRWVDGSQANRIRQRNYRNSGQRIPLDRSLDQLPELPLERGSPDVDAEGINVGVLTDRFASAVSTPASQQPAESDGGTTTDSNHQAEQSLSGVDTAFQADIRDRLAQLEATVSDLVEGTPSPDDLGSDLSPIEARLEEIEQTIDELPAGHTPDAEVVPATVIRQEDLVLLRVDDEELQSLETDLVQNQNVELSIRDESTDNE
jgi:putative mRNA 3-end processing factor